MPHVSRDRHLGLALSVGAAVLVAGTASAQVSVIDASGLVADHASLAIGLDGHGLIAYFDQSDLKVAHCSDLACTSATLSTVATNQGGEPSIAIGGDGMGLVVYQDTSTVGVAHCLDASCTSVETSLLAAGSPGNVVKGSDGLGLIVWTNTTSDIQVTHCANAACSSGVTTELGYGVGPVIGLGLDGLGLVVYDNGSGPVVNPVVVHCENVACTAFTSVQPPVGGYAFADQDLTLGGDGLAVFGYAGQGDDELAHCQDAGCTSFQSSALPAEELQLAETLATGPDGFVLAAANDAAATAFLHVWHCLDPLCASADVSPILDAKAGRPSIAVGSDGLPLIAYAVQSGELRVAHCLTSGCADEVAVSIGDVSVAEGDSGTTAAVFTLTLNHPSSLPVTVSYATADGTAHAPADYAAAAGTVSFPPGATAASLAIDVVGDTVYESDETFSVDLSAPVNAFLASTLATGTILNDDTGAYGPVVAIDTQGDVGDYVGLILGSDGLGLVSYYDRTNGDLKVAHCADVACGSALVSTLDSVGDVGGQTAVMLGGDQRALIGYSDLTNQNIKVAHCDDLACSSAQTQVLAPGRAGGVARGGDGLPLIVGTSGAALRVIHCDDMLCAGHTTTDYAGFALDPNVVIGPDGLGLVLFSTGNSIKALHCQNAACSSATVSTVVVQPMFFVLTLERGLAVGSDGRAFFVYSLVFKLPPGIQGGGLDKTIAHCGDADCSFVTGTTPDVPVPGAAAWVGPDGLGLLAGFAGTGLSVAHCADVTCSQTSSANPLAVGAAATAAVNAQDGYPLLAFYDSTSGDLDVEHCTQPACGAPPPFFLSISDVAQPEGNAGLSSFVFNVTLDPPSSLPVSVSFHTVNGSAASPEDYLSTSGTLSFAPGVASQTIPVSVVGDAFLEAEDFFSVVLDQAVNASISKPTGTGTIQNDDAPPVLLRTNAEVTEGDSGTTNASIKISMSYPPRVEALVDWGLGGGTATPVVDFLPFGNQLIFQPGEVSKVVFASVVGDTLVEPDEYFFVNLMNAVNATVDPSNGRITIVDDDAPSLSFDELVHGSVQRGNLQAQPGPVADVDYYRLGQSPYSSWEVVVDGVSSDLAPVVLQRLAADNATVLGTGTAVAGGSSVSMRWSNDTEFPILNQHLSVRSDGCGPSCDASAGYRIRAYETTGRIARFNDSATQVTVMVLSNTSVAPVQGTVYFWATDGTLLASQPVSLDPHDQFVLNTATIPALAGASGSITLTSDAPYESLQGKAVAVEPATGFTFDTAVEYRPR